MSDVALALIDSDAPSELAECEAVIERGLATFVDVGAALLRIRDQRLYRESHETFEDYCRDRWEMRRAHANRLVRAAEIAGTLDPTGSKPLPTERAIRELAPLTSEPVVLQGAWTEVVERHGDQPTAAQVREVVEEKRATQMGVHYSSATDEWSTPSVFFEAVAQEFAFDLDVCALDTSAKCARYFTPTDDGLAQDWTGTCWMNPPYGDEIPRWVAKAHESADAGATVVCLVPARVDTAWWWDHCRHAEIRFLRGRLKFGSSPNSAPFPSALVVFGRPANVVWWEWK